MSVLEGYALGKPVIGARIGGIPELIVENETGVTFASGDHVALAAALREFEARPASAVEVMGRAGRHLVEENFTADAYRTRLLQAFQELGVA